MQVPASELQAVWDNSLSNLEGQTLAKGISFRTWLGDTQWQSGHKKEYDQIALRLYNWNCNGIGQVKLAVI